MSPQDRDEQHETEKIAATFDQAESRRLTYNHRPLVQNNRRIVERRRVPPNEPKSERIGAQPNVMKNGERRDQLEAQICFGELENKN